jgi:hypothetical protein
MKRRLVLKKETLAELSTAELGIVAGAAQALTPNCPTNYCASGRPDCIGTVQELSAAMNPCPSLYQTCLC